MKKLIVLLVLLLPITSFGACFEVAGFGNTARNGLYEETVDTYAGYPVYQFGVDKYIAHISGDDGWLLTDDYVDWASVGGYYSVDCDTSPDLCVSWDEYLDTAGVGTVTGVSCDAEEETASTTTEITYQDWIFVNSIQIFLMSFIFLGFLFSVFKKRR